uniref:DUF4939 domain-containing protein n=1 Tax=Oreochromis aureus TaxID=47969 RepID=A0AAZ1WXJ5_OREAU
MCFRFPGPSLLSPSTPALLGLSSYSGRIQGPSPAYPPASLTTLDTAELRSPTLGAQYQSLHATQENFLAALQEIRTALPGAPSRAAQSPAEPPQPEPYSGEPGPYGTFLLKCDLAFTYSPHTFTTDSVKLAYLVAKLQGKVLSWAEAYLSVHPLPTCSYDEFLGEFKKTFAHPVAEGSTEERLLRLQQGNQALLNSSLILHSSSRG